MDAKWISEKMRKHPGEHRKGTWGYLYLFPDDLYMLRQGGNYINCPQAWAAECHAAEIEERRERSIL